MLQAPRPGAIQGFSHIEIVVPMTLGRRVTQPSRYHPQQVAAFAAWKDEAALEEFLAYNHFGMALAHGWHVRMELDDEGVVRCDHRVRFLEFNVLRLHYRIERFQSIGSVEI